MPGEGVRDRPPNHETDGSRPTPVFYDDREYVWKMMCGSRPMPRQEPGAARRYSGSLAEDFDPTPESIEAAFEQIDRE